MERYVFYECPLLTIHCDAVSRPEGWDPEWNPDHRPVIWALGPEQSESSSQPSGDAPFGPSGAEKASWWLVGEGATFSSWTIEGGLQLWTNPDNPMDKGCALNVSFAAGDTFKVTNGDDIWFGYENVDPYDDPMNAGLYCFKGVEDGYGGSNFQCVGSGYYDVYVNMGGVFWIQKHA